MSETTENKELEAEQTAPATEETAVSVPPTAEMTTAPEDEPAEKEEDDDAPVSDKVFGMPRLCFQCTAIGIGLGYVLYGLIGILFQEPPFSAMVFVLCCGALGYFLSSRVIKRRDAEAAAAAKADSELEAHESADN